jgi:hypothetical protein
MEGLLALVGSCALSGGIVLVVTRRLGLSKGQIIACTVISTLGMVGAWSGLFVVGFSECWAENTDRPLSWPWSPRRQFCQPGTLESRAALLVLLAPAIVALTAALCFWRRLTPVGVVVLLLIATVPFLPMLYVSQLPYYLLDSYPVLHDPYVRPESQEMPARACYAYSIVYGPSATPVTEGSERICADLARTPEASELVPDYESLPDYSTIRWRLEWLGKRLTEEEMHPGTEYDGLIAERVYTLPGVEARKNSFFARTL